MISEWAVFDFWMGGWLINRWDELAIFNVHLCMLNSKLAWRRQCPRSRASSNWRWKAWAVQQLKSRWMRKKVAESIGNGLVGCDRCILISYKKAKARCVLVSRLVNVFSLSCTFLQMSVALIYVTIINWHHLIAIVFFTMAWAWTKVLNHSSIGIFTI